MEQRVIDRLEEVFPAKWFQNPLRGRKHVGWFLLEISPLPPLDELELVVADIIKDNVIDVSWGQALHSEDCTRTNHNIPQLVKNIIENLEDQKFIVAVYPGVKNVYGGQPVAIALEPQINYQLYPDHPHLNPGYITNRVNGENFFLPDSFCYIDDPASLGNDAYERMLQAFCKISIWLFRHQVWVETRKFITKGEWIGLEGKPLPSSAYPEFINPLGMCRCGKGESYVNCHMLSDLGNYPGYRKHQDKPSKNIVEQKFVFQSIKKWNEKVRIPHDLTINQLKRSMTS